MLIYDEFSAIASLPQYAEPKSFIKETPREDRLRKRENTYFTTAGRAFTRRNIRNVLNRC
ncbi:MAG: hypothetical protein JWN60_1721 [Acidobacteria bacterium]|nr:hypothetical protein [Acidobacteriota bacterium]